MPKTKITPNDIILKARQLVGVKWTHQGRHRIPSEGVDCAGLIIWTMENLGLATYEEHANYRRTTDGRILELICNRWLDPVPGGVRDMKIGDIAIIAFKLYPIHMGFIADAGYPYSLIHALSTAGKVVEHSLDEGWVAKIKRVHRFRGIEE